jgi:hypothetical protein
MSLLDPGKIRSRVARMTTDDLMLWADNAATGMQRYLDDFRRHPDEAFLGEVKLAALSMDVVVDELSIRLRQQQEQLAREQQGV